MKRADATTILAALDAIQASVDQLRAAILCDARPSGLVSLKQAARLTGLHPRTVRRHAHAGAGTKVGGAWRIDMSALTGGQK